MTEKDYLRFLSKSGAKSFQAKVSAMPEVKLILADGNAFPNQGKIQMIDGLFDKATGAISVRAMFNNKENTFDQNRSEYFELQDAIAKEALRAIATPRS